MVLKEKGILEMYRQVEIYFSVRSGVEYFQSFGLPLYKLDLSTCAVVRSDKSIYKFSIQDSLYSKYTMEAQSEEDRDFWVRILGSKEAERERHLARLSTLSHNAIRPGQIFIPSPVFV